MVATKNILLAPETASPVANSRQAQYPWDAFDAADLTAMSGRVMPSGHTWIGNGAGAATARITNGGYESNDNCYMSVNHSATVYEAEGVCSWDGTSAGTQLCICLVSDGANPLNAGMVHLNFTPSSWILMMSKTGAGSLVPAPYTLVSGTDVPLVAGSYLTPTGALVTDGRKYKIRLVADVANSIFYAYLPDGQVAKWTGVTDLSSYIGTGCFWQTSGTARDARWHSATMGPTLAHASKPVVSPELARLQSQFVTLGNRKRLTVPQVIPLTANGWYTIAQQVNDGSNRMLGGFVRLFGYDQGGRKVDLEIVVGCEAANTTSADDVFTVQPIMGKYAGGVVDQIRLSKSDNTDTASINLDIHISTANASGSTLYATYDGSFTPVTSPVVGATVLASRNTVLLAYPVSDIYLPNQKVAEFAYTASGWFTVATQKTDPNGRFQSGGYVYMGGRIKWYARDDAGRLSIGEAVIGKAQSGQTPVLTQVYNTGDYVGFVIDQIRVTQDDGAHTAHLDIHTNQFGGNAGSVTVWLDGFFNPVAVPVVGATTLTTVTTSLTVT